jgi:Flp pilus assembly protein TadD
MPKPAKYIALLIAIAAVTAVAILLITFYKHDIRAEDILTGYQEQAQYSDLEILYPFDETLFPPEIVSPTFRWQDGKSKSNAWLVTIKFLDGEQRLNFVTRRPQWTPKAEDWETIKKQSLEKPATVNILGVRRSAPAKILSADEISIQTSKDEVGAPLFYREVDLPFVNAVKDPSHIRWCFGAVSSPKQPPVVLEKMPVCGNCHSFCANGKILAMDIDYANDKGSYAIAQVAEEITLNKNNIITWSDYKKDDAEPTFGLLSQISPDGRYVVSTVKDESVFVPKPGLAFSQLFFPIKGILCIYDRQTRTFQALPGADDPNYVQSNASWSPDGKHIVFARSERYRLKNVGKNRSVLLTPEQCREFLEDERPFLFDLYKIPFNDGKGGKPVPLRGASNNGMSNYFARYSPNGKWIVFCKARSYMLLQPDSELYIIPAEGGEARKMRCNTNRMNSWHSWSPNGKWLVFSSKLNSPYTQLFLTHIDEQGHSTPAVLLEHFTAPDRAANIPEFVNTKASAISKIREKFIDDVSYVRAAYEFLKANDFEFAAQACKKALVLNPQNAKAHDNLGLALFGAGKYDEAIRHLREAVAIAPDNAGARTHLGTVLAAKGMLNEAVSSLSEALRLDPNNADVHYNLGVAMFRLEKTDEAIRHWLHAIRLAPEDTKARYSLAVALLRLKKFSEATRYLLEVVHSKPDHVGAHHRLGLTMVRLGNIEQATVHLSEAARLDPNNGDIQYNLAMALARQAKTDEAIKHLLKAVRLAPNDFNALLHLGASYAQIGRFSEAISYTERAYNLARAAGDQALARQIQQRLEIYREKYHQQQFR